MNEVFADTAFWIALQWEKDSFHRAAVRSLLSLSPNTRIVTSDLVLVEFLNFASGSRILRQEAVSAWEEWNSDARILVFATTQDRLRQAAEFYKRSSDKAWSLTDCASFVIMRERGIDDALTSDHHFEQAGFRALLLKE